MFIIIIRNIRTGKAHVLRRENVGRVAREIADKYRGSNVAATIIDNVNHCVAYRV